MGSWGAAACTPIASVLALPGLCIPWPRATPEPQWERSTQSRLHPTAAAIWTAQPRPPSSSQEPEAWGGGGKGGRPVRLRSLVISVRVGRPGASLTQPLPRCSFQLLWHLRAIKRSLGTPAAESRRAWRFQSLPLRLHPYIQPEATLPGLSIEEQRMDSCRPFLRDPGLLQSSFGSGTPHVSG